MTNLFSEMTSHLLATCPNAAAIQLLLANINVQSKLAVCGLTPRQGTSRLHGFVAMHCTRLFVIISYYFLVICKGNAQ
jgi:hypothetical protein